MKLLETHGDFDGDKVELNDKCKVLAGTCGSANEFAVLCQGLLYTHDPKTKKMTLQTHHINHQDVES
eukprot:SAG22_NODE_350_length_11853_cov_3.693211_13_plen_67_part_00